MRVNIMMSSVLSIRVNWRGIRGRRWRWWRTMQGVVGAKFFCWLICEGMEVMVISRQRWWESWWCCTNTIRQQWLDLLWIISAASTLALALHIPYPVWEHLRGHGLISFLVVISFLHVEIQSKINNLAGTVRESTAEQFHQFSTVISFWKFYCHKFWIHFASERSSYS